MTKGEPVGTRDEGACKADYPTVLSLCDRTGVMVKPWLEAGFRCVTVDLQHPKGETVEGNLSKVGVDLSTWLPPLETYGIVFAFPPCTHLAVLGARWFKQKGLQALIEGLTLVERCRYIAEWTGAPWMLENPVSTISSYWRKPDYTFQPHEYGGYLPGGGDAYTKRTCLWTGNGFVMPEKRSVEPTEGSKMHLVPPGPNQADIRAVTPEGFARAVFAANAPLLGYRPQLAWEFEQREEYEPSPYDGTYSEGGEDVA